MDWNDLLAALAIYLVLEGLFPFLSPSRWRESMAMIARLPERQLRVAGLISMLAGLMLLAWVRA